MLLNFCWWLVEKGSCRPSWMSQSFSGRNKKFPKWANIPPSKRSPGCICSLLFMWLLPGWLLHKWKREFSDTNLIRSKKKLRLFQLNTSFLIIMLVPCSGGSRGGVHGFHGTPLSQESTADYVASYWAIIAYFLGFVCNCCCGFCD